MSLFVPVSRQGLKIKQQPSEVIEPGSIFGYRGTYKRLQHWLLIHSINPQYSQIKNEDGSSIIATDMAVVEALLPEHNYSDYCLFWVAKQQLVIPPAEQYQILLHHLTK